MSQQLRATFTAAAQVDAQRRRIVGMVLPWGEPGNAGLDGEPATVTFEAGSLSWDDTNAVALVINHTGQAPVFAGRARDLVDTDAGIIGTFKVLPGPNGDQALVEAQEGLRAGLSIEADVEVQPQPDGTYLVTAANPGQLRRVALVDTPAFPTARISEASPKSQPVMRAR